MAPDNAQPSTLVLGNILSWLRPRLPRVMPRDTRNWSWARRLNSYAELPGIYRGFFDLLPGNPRGHFPYTVLMPTFKGIPRRTEREKLLCMTDDDLYVLERLEGGLGTARYPLEGRCCLEQGTILLHSWITIHGRTSDGSLKTTTVRFNTVTDHIMAPFVERMRAAPIAGEVVNPDAERGRFDHLARSNFKFFSHGRATVRSGTRVLQIILQPEIRGQSLRVLRYSLSKRVSCAHLSILTDRELILIKEDDSQFWLKGSPHGAIWSFIPLRLIETTSLARNENRLLELLISVKDCPQLKSTFEASARPEVEQLLQQMQI